MDMEIKEKIIPENLVALHEYSGDGLNNTLFELFEWAKESKVKIQGAPFSVFKNFNSEKEVHYCGVSIRGDDLKVPDCISIKSFSKHLVLSSIHVGSHDSAYKTYDEIVEYAGENNYTVLDTSYLVFFNNPLYTDKDHLISDVQVNVLKD